MAAFCFLDPVCFMRSVRINAYLAAAGLGSRRSVEDLIVRGKIIVNREVIRDLAFRVDPEKDVVVFKGKPLRPQLFRYILLNKPKGFACTKYDPHASRIIYDLLPRDLHHLVHVGRLDEDSEGLLLLTNDGQWVNKVLHPSNQVAKYYEVEVERRPSEREMENAVKGLRHKGELLKIESFKHLGENRRTSTWELVLKQGKKREIRRIFGCLGYEVVNLKRVAIGKLKLGNLATGKWRDLTDPEKEKIFS